MARLNVTATPDPVPVNGTFHVEGCGFPRNSDITVKVSGPPDGDAPFWNVSSVTSDAQGCVSFDSAVGPAEGQYIITFHENRPNGEYAIGDLTVTATP
jgi:hypothetical protein